MVELWGRECFPCGAVQISKRTEISLPASAYRSIRDPHISFFEEKAYVHKLRQYDSKGLYVNNANCSQVTAKKKCQND